MKKLGMLFGAEIMINTEDENIKREALKWLETMDMRYRKFGEEKLIVL